MQHKEVKKENCEGGVTRLAQGLTGVLIRQDGKSRETGQKEKLDKDSFRIKGKQQVPEFQRKCVSG